MAIEDDVTNISAADIQRLARQYLVPGRKWSLAVRRNDAGRRRRSMPYRRRK